MKTSILGILFSLITCFIVCQFESRDVDTTTGVVSWWASEDNANDRIGPNGGALVGGVTFTAGKVGRAYQFNGTNSCVIVPNSPTLNPAMSFSFEGWIYPEKDTFSTILGKWGCIALWENQRSYTLCLLRGGKLSFGISNDALQWDFEYHAFQTSGRAVTFNEWNHVAVVYDQPRGARRIYINGSLAADTVTTPITITTGISDLCVGAYEPEPGKTEAHFKGKLDELTFYNRAITPREIESVYTAGSNGKKNLALAR